MKQRLAMILTCGLMAATATAEEISMVVGTYTDGGSHGIYSYAFDQQTGQLRLLDSLAMENPSFLTFAADGKRLYAVSENHDATAALAAIDFDAASGRMRPVGTPQPTGGEDPCFVAQRGSVAVTANYSGGSMSVFPLHPDGTLGACSQRFKGHTAHQPAPQDWPHVHAARFMADGSILATDFSADQLLRFAVGANGKVGKPRVVGRTLPGSAPRHIELSADGRFVYVMSELAGSVTVFGQGRRGRLDRLQVIASDSVGGRGGADLHLSPDGHHLYASNRLKADGISIFEVDRASGRLTKVGYQPTEAHPRNFALSPNGRFLLCACRDGNCIQVFGRNADTGELTLLHSATLSKPVCIQFHP